MPVRVQTTHERSRPLIACLFVLVVLTALVVGCISFVQASEGNVTHNCHDAQFGASITTTTTFPYFGTLVERRGMSQSEFMRYCAARRDE